MGEMDLVAITAFGMEALVVRELAALGYENSRVEDGRVHFRGDENALARTNLWLRCAERVQIVVADFECLNFDDLFDTVKELPWEQWLTVDAKFPVSARIVRAEIRSLPNSQKMVKRAIVERLRKVYQRHWFEETGIEYSVEASFIGDRCVMTIDTTGDGLHKRGYRKFVGPAPLRETVAAALVKLSYWNRDRFLIDPFCGSGTIPIEAALIARNIAPGMIRNFSSEEWPHIKRSVWTEARKEARDLQDRRPMSIAIMATDRDREAVRMTRMHAKLAGVDTDLHVERKEFVEFPINRDYGVLICNPPYGERMGTSDDVRQLYNDMGDILAELDDWSLYILTAFERFESEFGRRADRRRKLFNARIPCTYFQYLGPKPPHLPQGPDEEEASLERAFDEASGSAGRSRDEETPRDRGQQAVITTAGQDLADEIPSAESDLEKENSAPVDALDHVESASESESDLNEQTESVDLGQPEENTATEQVTLENTTGHADADVERHDEEAAAAVEQAVDAVDATEEAAAIEQTVDAEETNIEATGDLSVEPTLNQENAPVLPETEVRSDLEVESTEATKRESEEN